MISSEQENMGTPWISSETEKREFPSRVEDTPYLDAGRMTTWFAKGLCVWEHNDPPHGLGDLRAGEGPWVSLQRSQGAEPSATVMLPSTTLMLHRIHSLCTACVKVKSGCSGHDHGGNLVFGHAKMTFSLGLHEGTSHRQAQTGIRTSSGVCLGFGAPTSLSFQAWRILQRKSLAPLKSP